MATIRLLESREALARLAREPDDRQPLGAFAQGGQLPEGQSPALGTRRQPSSSTSRPSRPEPLAQPSRSPEAVPDPLSREGADLRMNLSERSVAAPLRAHARLPEPGGRPPLRLRSRAFAQKRLPEGRPSAEGKPRVSPRACRSISSTRSRTDARARDEDRSSESRSLDQDPDRSPRLWRRCSSGARAEARET